MSHAFNFNGVSSADLKLVVQKLPPRPVPKQRVTSYTVPGRSGSLHTTDGSYDSVVLTVECVVTDSSKIPEICVTYQGSGRLTHDGILGYYYIATVLNISDIARMSSKWGVFQIQFECQPFLYHDAGDVPVSFAFDANGNLLNGGGSFINPGTVSALPKITVFGTGTIKMTLNGLSYTFADVAGSITVDSDNLTVYTGAAIVNSKMTGSGFPYYKTGSNSEAYQLIGQGQLVSITRTPRWRSL